MVNYLLSVSERFENSKLLTQLGIKYGASVSRSNLSSGSRAATSRTGKALPDLCTNKTLNILIYLTFTFEQCDSKDMFLLSEVI